MGLLDFIRENKIVFVELCHEFFTTLHLDNSKDKKLKFRAFGKEGKLDYAKVNSMFKFPKGGLCEPNSKFDA